MKCRLLCVVVILVICVTSLSACIEERPEPKTFTVFDMRIELNDRFTEKQSENYDGVFISQNIAVYVTKDDFDNLDEERTEADLELDEYARQLIKNSGLDCTVSQDKGLVTFTYYERINGKKFAFYTVIYRSQDAFWRVQFVGLPDVISEQKDVIRDYAWTVEFSQ